jgi:DNA adenine methylase
MYEIINPFLRWAGGKAKIIKQIKEFIPDDVKERHYREPFLGAGSLYFALQPAYGTISDLNPELINCYLRIRDNPAAVDRALRELVKKNTEKFYYDTRKVFNKRRDSFSQAARFIYLNKTCYNGLFRVNKKGEFNVPFGQIKSPAIPALPELEKVSKTLKKITIETSCYQQSVKSAASGDFIYFDPPYPALNATSFFNNYTKDVFKHEEQVALADTSKKLSDRGCLVLISNADTAEVRKLYKGWDIIKLNTTRFISCKSERMKVDELIIKNY